MKIAFRIIWLGLLLFWGQPRHLPAQEPASAGCTDLLLLRDGSKLRGQLKDIKSGDTLIFQLHTGPSLEVPQSRVRRVIQRCSGSAAMKPVYDFREQGWYHHTRAAVLPGQAYYALNRIGFQLHHSSGRMIKRWLGIGLGAGVEFFDPKGYDAASYPVFAEVRGYLLPQKITPYYTLAGGWAFAGRATDSQSWLSSNDHWRGGWMMEADAGYRIGNHFTVHFGLRLQRKTREWTSIWGPDNGQGTDRILHKRFVLGIGLLF